MTSSPTRRWWHALVLLMLISTLLAACGGTGNEGGAATTGPATGTEQTQAPVTAQTEPPAAVETTAPAVDTPAPAMEETATTAMMEETATSAMMEETATAATMEETATAAGGAAETATPEAGGATTGTGNGGTAAAAGGFTLNTDVSGTVEFWHFWGSPLRRNAIRRVIAICQQQLPNIKVNETFKPFGDIWTANIAAVAAGSGMPDVIVEDRPQLRQRALDGIATNLGEFAQRDGIDGSQFWPFAWEQTVYEGNTYGLPFETDVRVLFWNKNAFREVGLDPEKPPTTWAEAEEYAAKLDKKNDDGTYARIGMFPLIKAGPDIWGYTNDVEWITAEGQPAVNTPQAVETIEWIKKWVDKYGGWQALQDFRGQFAAPPQDEFMSGKVAMIVDIAGYSSQLNFYRPRVPKADNPEEMENLDWGVSDMPYNTDKGTWSGGFALSIPKGAPNAEAAWEFIKCAAGPDGALSWSRDTYAIPAIQAAANDPVLMADPNWQVFVNAMSYSTGGNYNPDYPNWGEQLGNRYEQIWTGELSPKDALDEAQAAIEEGPEE